MAWLSEERPKNREIPKRSDEQISEVRKAGGLPAPDEVDPLSLITVTQIQEIDSEGAGKVVGPIEIIEVWGGEVIVNY